MQANYPSVTDENQGVFAVLTQTMVVAKRGGVEEEMLEGIYKIGSVHGIDPWDIDQAADLELSNPKIKKIA